MIYEPNHKPEIKLDIVVESYCRGGGAAAAYHRVNHKPNIRVKYAHFTSWLVHILNLLFPPYSSTTSSILHMFLSTVFLNYFPLVNAVFT